MLHQDFEIIVNGSADHYTVEARGPQEISTTPAPLAFTWTAELQQEIARIQQGYAPSRQQMQQLGELLFNALFPRAIARAYLRAQGELAEGERLRLKLIIRPPELNALPWELLYDADEGYFMAVRLGSPVVRFIESSTPVESLATQAPLKILYVQAQPQGVSRLDLSGSENTIRQALGSQAQITVLQQATPEKLRALLRQPFHILHYDGHGAYDETQRSGFLYLQDENGQQHPLSGESLAGYLDGSSIRLVVLAACESGMDSPHQRFSGIAQQMMRTSGIPAVIAMQFGILDPYAIAFNRGFYSALAAKDTLDMALVEGRKAILEAAGSDPFGDPGWATPVLFLRAKNTQLLIEPPARETPPAGGGTVIQIGDVYANGGTINIAGGDIHQTNLHQPGPTQPTALSLSSLLTQIQLKLALAGLQPQLASQAAARLQTIQQQTAQAQPDWQSVCAELRQIQQLVRTGNGRPVKTALLLNFLDQALQLAQKS